MKQTPFWVDDHSRPEGLTSDLPDETDYLIIGSGLTGLTAALRLSSSGESVTVIEAREVASGASSINGGMVSPDVKAGIRAVFQSYGPEIGRGMWDSTVRSVDLVRDLATRPGIDAIVHDNGLAALGRGTRKLREFESSVTWYRENLGVDWHVLAGDEVGKVVGGSYFDAALYEPEGFGVHPARLVFGLAREVTRSDAIIVDQCEAVSTEERAGLSRVHTTRGTISARNLVIATNGYTTSRFHAELARLIVPVGSYIIVTEPVGPEMAETIFPGGTMTYTRKRLLNYMRPTHDDRILLGGRRSLHPGLDLEESAEDLRRTLVTYWPELEGVALSHVWGGKLGIPFDLTPHIGRIGGAWYAMGYAGHGLGLACQLGHELAGMLLGEDPPSVYSRIRHRGRFYYSGRSSWFLTPASYLYRVLDKVGI